MDQIFFEAGSTTHLTAWSVDGSVGNFIEILSSVAGTAHNLVNDTASPFVSTYVIISDSHASIASLWEASTGAVDFGGNTGWFTTDSPVTGDRIYFTPTETYNITSWSVDGSAGNSVLITSYPPTAQHNLVRASGGPFTSDWANILYSNATLDADWEAQSNSFDAGNNTGWFGGGADSWIPKIYWLM
jgi:hypothetical protein